VYRSELALWEDTQRKSPHKARVYNNLGCAYARAVRHDAARRAYEAALRSDQDYALARSNLNALSNQGSRHVDIDARFNQTPRY